MTRNLTPPPSVRKAAARALAWRRAGHHGALSSHQAHDMGIGSGVVRAATLAHGRNVSPETVKRMASYFARHEVDKRAPGFYKGDARYPSRGRVAWDAWGGDAGWAWARKVMGKKRNPDTDLWLVGGNGGMDLFLVDPSNLSTAAFVQRDQWDSVNNLIYGPVSDVVDKLQKETGARVVPHLEWTFIDANAVPADNREKLAAAVEELAKRAARAHMPAPIVLYGPNYVVRSEHGGADGVAFQFRGLLPTPKLPGGWRFVAALDHTLPSGKALVYNRSGKELPAHYYTDPQFCEHCQTRRNRNLVFAIQNDKGKFLKIGSTCLREYLGVNPIAMLSSALWGDDLARAIMEEDVEGYGMPKAQRVRHVVMDRFLATAHSAIRHFGRFVSMKDNDPLATPTAHQTVEIMFPNPKLPPDQYKALLAMAPTEADYQTAALVRSWAATLEPLDDYRRNVRAILAEDVLARRHMGFAAAAVGGYLRDKANQIRRQAEQEAARSGPPAAPAYAIGDRITARVTVVDRRIIDTVYGQTKLIKMIDDAGRALTTFASGEFNGESGEQFAVTGTVKSVKEFRGVPETMLSRCVRWTDEGWRQHLEKEAKKAARAAKRK
jgi:hypothetical protein